MTIVLTVLATVAVMLTAVIMVTGAFFARAAMLPSAAVALIGATITTLAVHDQRGWPIITLGILVAVIGALLTLISSGGEG